MVLGGGNGQWVRARNQESAKAFMQERQLEAERHEAARIRSQAFWAGVWKAIARRARSIWRRIRR